MKYKLPAELYFLRGRPHRTAGCLYKIGVSFNATQRLKAMEKSGYPCLIDCLAVASFDYRTDAEQAEKQVLQKLSKYRICGSEWLDLPGEIVTKLSSNLDAASL
jgi:hypothetical protein